MDFKQFLAWEQTTHDTIDFKKLYVDIAGDILAGLVLSVIIYWHLPDKQGRTKLRVPKKGKLWIAARRYEWWERARLSPRQIDNVLKKLQTQGLIEKQLFKFKGDPTVHVRLNEVEFLKRADSVINTPLENPYLPKQEKPNSQNGDFVSTSEDNSLLPDSANPPTESSPESSPEIIRQNLYIDAASSPNFWEKFDNVRQAPNLDLKDKNKESPLETDFKEINHAIGEAWNTKAPGQIEEIRQTLLGQHPPESPYFVCNIEPPATAAQIRQLGEYFRRHYPGAKMPLNPVKIQAWFYQSRELTFTFIDHKNHVIPFYVNCPADLTNKKDEKQLLNFLKKYHPIEYVRVQEIIEHIDNILGESSIRMFVNPILDYGEYSFYLPFSIPLSLVFLKTPTDTDFNWKSIITYVKEEQPEHWEYVMSQIKAAGIEEAI